MSAPRYVGVLDVGKTNAKWVVRDLDRGTDLCGRSMPNRVLRDSLYPHYDVAAIKAFWIDGLAELVRDGTVPEALVVTAHGASGAVVGADDLALPVLDYEYDGPDTLAEAYDRIRPAFAETCSPRLPAGLNLGAQLFWQSRSFPEAFGRARAIVTYPQYWAWWLTGVASTEATSLGAHTDLWDPRRAALSGLAARAGLAGLIAPRRNAWDVLGPVRPEIAQRLGLAQPLPVLCGIHDSNASLLPYRLGGGEPLTLVSTGTWAIVFGLGGTLDGLDPDRDTLANVDLFGKPIPSARAMAGREFDLVAGPGEHPEPDPGTVARLIEAQIMVLPTLVPGAGPFGRARGGWNPAGAEAGLGPAERVAAASLYTGLVTAACLETLKLRGPTLVEGPFSANALYLDVLAASTGRPVLLPEAAGGSAAGAASLARIGTLAGQLPQTRLHAPRYGLDHSFRRYAETWRERASAG